MKISVKENRELIIINNQNTQNENGVETIELTTPKRFENFIKKIVFVTDDAVVSRLFVDNLYTIEADILQYDYVEFYIWMTKDTEDWRSKTKPLGIYLNKKLTGEVTPAEKSEMERVIDVLDEKILEVEGLENEIQTKLDNGDFDGKDGVDGQDGISPTITETQTQNGYNITITDKNGTNTISLLNGQNGQDGKDGADGKDGKDGVNGKDGKDGATGATGNGISNITKTNTSGLIDTYTITYTNGNTTTYQVTNGANGQNRTKWAEWARWLYTNQRNRLLDTTRYGKYGIRYFRGHASRSILLGWNN